MFGANCLWVLFNLLVLLLLNEGKKGSKQPNPRREGGIKDEIGEGIREQHPVGRGGEKVWKNQA